MLLEILEMTKLSMVPKTNLFTKKQHQPNTTNPPLPKLKNTQPLLKIHTHHQLKNQPMLVMVLLLMMVMVLLLNTTMVPMMHMPHLQNMTMVLMQVHEMKFLFSSKVYCFL